MVTRGGKFVTRTRKLTAPKRNIEPRSPLSVDRRIVGDALDVNLAAHREPGGELGPVALLVEDVLVPGGGWLDLTRSAALWNEVFEGPSAIRDVGMWVDRPSINVPYAYLFAGAELSEALRLRGRPADSVKVLDSVNALARAVGVEGLSR